ncbi:hypothetical protein APA_5059 [Pseudanabaena sp. lw0831]|uniref:glycosyltransferase family 1 protein n=1 Tax=Pseudanabaena sp. lw0831 TaxID=1357935 RepID=UPI001915B8C9|nr:glycosyltransferase family 1 protein [Pseudanabaena sp. lw0831]GBO56724.1 hypothetical protein APA_5059 [Pseudanabaena sp. lw0831]
MSDLSTVISIVPRLPNAIDGVGDYALNLARQLRQDFNIQTQFIVGNPEWHGELEIEGFSVNQVIDSNSAQLAALLEGDRTSPVLLHYVGYGYAKRGCPIWLVDGIQRWKNLYPQRSLVTMFHELYASSYLPWQSSFWLSPLQKNLATRLAKLSDRSITNTQSYAETLCKLLPNQRFESISLPVFSNIGELNHEIPLSKRTKRLVTFGHKNSRVRIYQEYVTDLEQICQDFNVEEICDIGSPTGVALPNIRNVPIVEKGIIESSQISKILNDSIIGFLIFPPPLQLAKSTIFAAYCAHGLIPYMVSGSAITINNLEMGKHYLSTSNPSYKLSLKIGQEIANNAYDWYQTHSLSKQAKIFSKYLFTRYQ